MITVEKILFLRGVALFDQLPPKQLAHIAAIAEEVIYPSGAQIIRERDYGDCMFLIADGEVRISFEGKQLAILGPGEYFGEMSILDGEPRSASAFAATDCLLLRIRQSDFHNILARNFNTVLAIVKTISRRLRKQIDSPAP